MLDLSSKCDRPNAATASEFMNHYVHWNHEEPLFSQLIHSSDIKKPPYFTRTVKM